MGNSSIHSGSEIIDQIRRGDVGAFSQLFRQYYEPLCFFAGRFIRDGSAAESVVQDVFVKLWDMKNALSIEISLRSYLYTSVRNSCLNYIKHERFFSSLEYEEERSDKSSVQPDVQLESSELAEEVDKAVRKLPPKCRQIFWMAKYDGLSYQEIAEIQNVSVNTVKTQLKRALKALGKSLRHLLVLLLLLRF